MSLSTVDFFRKKNITSPITLDLKETQPTPPPPITLDLERTQPPPTTLRHISLPSYILRIIDDNLSIRTTRNTRNTRNTLYTPTTSHSLFYKHHYHTLSPYFFFYKTHHMTLPILQHIPLFLLNTLLTSHHHIVLLFFLRHFHYHTLTTTHPHTPPFLR